MNKTAWMHPKKLDMREIMFVPVYDGPCCQCMSLKVLMSTVIFINYLDI